MRALILTAALLSGCALEPNALRLEAAHTSHLLQHDWMTEWSRAQPGYDAIGVVAHWQRGSAYADVGEYYSPECLDGQHEVFQARFGYEWKLHE
jgi:hypothetical protein